MLLYLLYASLASAAVFSSYGCFAENDVKLLLSLQGDYLYQSTSYCQERCQSYRVAALINGKGCYCGLTLPLLNLKKESSNCQTPCQGYGLSTCGGNGYFAVYLNGDNSVSSQGQGSGTESSTPGSSASTGASASNLQSSNNAASLKSSSSTESTQSTTSKPSMTLFVSTTTPKGGGSHSVVEVTTTVSSSSSASGSSASTHILKPPPSKKMSSGQIAGAVIGSIAGVLSLGIGAFFLWRKKHYSEKDEDDFFDLGDRDARRRGFDSVIPNSYSGNLAPADAGHHTHSTSETSNSYTGHPEALYYDERKDEFVEPRVEDFGRRRLSDGSLPDMVARGPGTLKVINR